MAWGTNVDLKEARLLAYVRKFGFVEHAVLTQCRLETIKNQKDSTMMTAPEEAAFIAFLIKLHGCRNALEVGVFTGYSSLSIALALPADGSLTVCELDSGLLEIAQKYWQQARVKDKIRALNQSGIDALNALILEGKTGSFDFAYIDADKENYRHYYELSLQLLQKGGLIILDNMLWGGRVSDRRQKDPITENLRQLNQDINLDNRVDSILTTIGDGVIIARKL